MDKPPLSRMADLDWNEAGEPISKQFGDGYFSKTNGRAETDFVFIQNNCLLERWAMGGGVHIGELGFGTGLNVLETWRQWKIHRKTGQTLVFESLEGFPMTKADMARALSAWPELAEESEILLGGLPDMWPEAPAQIHLALDAQTQLILNLGLAEEVIDAYSGGKEAWFLDGFAPSRNEAMWTPALLKTVFDKTAVGGSFATYTSAGWVRRNLEEAGFAVQKISGYANKRAMTIGHKP